MFPEIVRQTQTAAHGVPLMVSTVKIAPQYYDTVIFNDSEERSASHLTFAGMTVDQTNIRNITREAAMETHRAALDAIGVASRPGEK
ncbi:hypothetical protein OG709_30135 [Streptomyces sp. NBC_01267]|uniref:hypothetical protein n=1 Tax=Streptomyces sp. NBC_01267 TaxID=2903805 RepID=UPI002E3347ED|nr:hypothetical protein [Streptomyces sp. NBC_01267]